MTRETCNVQRPGVAARNGKEGHEHRLTRQADGLSGAVDDRNGEGDWHASGQKFNVARDMTTSIVDVSSACGAKGAVLYAASVRTIIRYCPRDAIRPSKRLALAEAQALTKAGLRLAIVHEGRYGDRADSRSSRRYPRARRSRRKKASSETS